MFAAVYLRPAVATESSMFASRGPIGRQSSSCAHYSAQRVASMLAARVEVIWKAMDL